MDTKYRSFYEDYNPSDQRSSLEVQFNKRSQLTTISTMDIKSRSLTNEDLGKKIMCFCISVVFLCSVFLNVVFCMNQGGQDLNLDSTRVHHKEKSVDSAGCSDTCTQATASAIIDCLPDSDDQDEWQQCVIQKLPTECSFECSGVMIGSMANCFGSIYNDTEWNKCVFSQIPEGSYCYECLCELAYQLSGQWVWTCSPKLSSSIVDNTKLIKTDAMFSLLTEVKESGEPKEHFLEGPAVNQCGACSCCIGVCRENTCDGACIRGYCNVEA